MADATILAFPVQTIRQRDEDRLNKALGNLHAALAGQKVGLSEWRFAMTELGIGVASLGHTLMSYQDSLGTVEQQLSGLHAEAAKLEQAALAVK